VAPEQPRAVSTSLLDGGGPITAVTVTNETCAGVHFGASISGSTITGTMAAGKGIPEDFCQGILRVFDTCGETGHAAVFALIK